MLLIRRKASFSASHTFAQEHAFLFGFCNPFRDNFYFIIVQHRPCEFWCVPIRKEESDRFPGAKLKPVVLDRYLLPPTESKIGGSSFEPGNIEIVFDAKTDFPVLRFYTQVL